MAKRRIHQVLNDGYCYIPNGIPAWTMRYRDEDRIREAWCLGMAETQKATASAKEVLRRFARAEEQVAISIRNMTDRIRVLEENLAGIRRVSGYATD